jgi:hypothetical protein
MDLSLKTLMAMVRGALVNPRQSVRDVLALQIAPGTGWLALILMAVLSALLSHLSFALMPSDAKEFMAEAMSSPIRTALIQWVAMLVSVHLIHRVGRWRGGVGTLAQTVVVAAWLQFILLCVQAVQVVAQIALPVLGNLLSIVGLVLFFFLLTNFVAELHRFKSLGAVFTGIVVTMLVVAFLLAIILVAFFGGTAGA